MNYALQGIASRADTTVASGVPVLVFNPLSWSRTDLVQTDVTFAAAPAAVRIYDDAGAEIPSQVLSINGNTAKVIFEANGVPFDRLQSVPRRIHDSGKLLHRFNHRFVCD